MNVKKGGAIFFTGNGLLLAHTTEEAERDFMMFVDSGRKLGQEIDKYVLPYLFKILESSQKNT